MARELSALINIADPGIDLIREWVGDNSERCSILPPDEGVRSDVLMRLQVTTRSILGAVAYDTGGILADNGRLRILGSGSDRSLMTANDTLGRNHEIIIVGDDVIGGVFAFNAGRFGPQTFGQIYYLAADDFVWTCLNVGYTDFVCWCVTDDHDMLYGHLTDFKPWLQEPPPLTKSLSFYPFLWTKEGRDGSGKIAIIDADEVVNVHIDLADQLHRLGID